jgi:hypothetical protein
VEVGSRARAVRLRFADVRSPSEPVPTTSYAFEMPSHEDPRTSYPRETRLYEGQW